MIVRTLALVLVAVFVAIGVWLFWRDHVADETREQQMEERLKEMLRLQKPRMPQRMGDFPSGTPRTSNESEPPSASELD